MVGKLREGNYNIDDSDKFVLFNDSQTLKLKVNGIR